MTDSKTPSRLTSSCQPRVSRNPLSRPLQAGLAIATTTAALSTTLLAAGPAQALDTIKLQYGSLVNMDIPYSALETFANTGKASSDLQLLMDVGKIDKTSAQNLLKQEITLDGRLIDRLTKSYMGEIILQQVGSMIKPGASATPWKDVQTALSLAAADGKVTGLEVLKSYQPKVLDIDGQKAMDIIGRVSKDFDDIKLLLGTKGGNQATSMVQNMLCKPGIPGAAMSPGVAAPKPMTRPGMPASTSAMPSTPAVTSPGLKPTTPTTPAATSPSTKPMTPAPAGKPIR